MREEEREKKEKKQERRRRKRKKERRDKSILCNHGYHSLVVWREVVFSCWANSFHLSDFCFLLSFSLSFSSSFFLPSVSSVFFSFFLFHRCEQWSQVTFSKSSFLPFSLSQFPLKKKRKEREERNRRERKAREEKERKKEKFSLREIEGKKIIIRWVIISTPLNNHTFWPSPSLSSFFLSLSSLSLPFLTHPTNSWLPSSFFLSNHESVSPFSKVSLSFSLSLPPSLPFCIFLPLSSFSWISNKSVFVISISIFPSLLEMCDCKKNCLSNARERERREERKKERRKRRRESGVTQCPLCSACPFIIIFVCDSCIRICPPFLPISLSLFLSSLTLDLLDLLERPLVLLIQLPHTHSISLSLSLCKYFFLSHRYNHMTWKLKRKFCFLSPAAKWTRKREREREV